MFVFDALDEDGLCCDCIVILEPALCIREIIH